MRCRNTLLGGSYNARGTEAVVEGDLEVALFDEFASRVEAVHGVDEHQPREQRKDSSEVQRGTLTHTHV